MYVKLDEKKIFFYNLTVINTIIISRNRKVDIEYNIASIKN